MTIYAKENDVIVLERVRLHYVQISSIILLQDTNTDVQLSFGFLQHFDFWTTTGFFGDPVSLKNSTSNRKVSVLRDRVNQAGKRNWSTESNWVTIDTTPAVKITLIIM